MKKILPAILTLLTITTPWLLFLANRETPAHMMWEENPREAYDALTFVTAAAAFPEADIPPAGYGKAWLHHFAMAKHPSTRTAWQSIGPNNVGGRTVSIAIDPVDTSVVWLGSASGGLWKSTTGGIGVNAWQQVPTGFPVLGVGAIAINPNDHNEMLIGTGETYSYGTSTSGLDDRTQRGSFGIGILRSKDGGTTWEKVLDWTYQNNRGVWDIVYNPSNPAVLYAATTEGIYRSHDGGDTWSNVLDKLMVMDILIDPVDTNVVFAGVGNEDSGDKGIYRTQDGGNTWELLTNGLPSNTHDGRITISSCAGNHNILMAIIGNRYSTVGVYRSEDGGDSWTLKSTADIMQWQGWYSKGLLIKADDATRVLAGGVYLYKSTNSGGSFSSFGSVHSDIHDIISNPLDANKVYVITDGGLYRSNSFTGNNWTECMDGYVTSQHYIGSVSHQDAALMLSGLQDNGTRQYTGSVYWNWPLGGDGCYNLINPDNDNIQFGCYQYLNIAKSTNGGSFFSDVYSSPSDPYGYNPAAFLAPLAMSASETNVIYAGTSTLLKSTNSGNSNSWNAVQPDPVDNENPVLSIGVSYHDPDTVYFATAPREGNPMHVYRSFNGGSSKEDITGDLPDRYVMRITVDPVDAKTVYAVMGGFSGSAGGHIFKSEDAGSTWVDISMSLPDVPFHCLMIDPDHTSNIYAGCDLSVYVSSNGGTDWFTYADGLPEAAMIWDLVLSPSDNTLLAFTHGNGVYKNDLLEDAVGVDEMPPLVSVGCFPNPASDVLTISFDRTIAGAEMRLINSAGAITQHRKIFSTRQFSWNVAGVPAGIYILQLHSASFDLSRKVAIIH